VDVKAEQVNDSAEDGFDAILGSFATLRTDSRARISALGVDGALSPTPLAWDVGAAAPVLASAAGSAQPGPRPPSRIRRPMLAAAGGLSVLLVVAGLSSLPAGDEVASAPASPPVLTPVPDLSTPVAPVIPPPAPEPTPDPEPEQAVGSIPIGIRIAALELDASTVPVGLEADGSMEIPSDVATIGWYEPAAGLGVIPGQTGTAVLAGHVDSRTQGAGAFYFLRELAEGARIEIVHEDGSTSRWRVTSRIQYPKDELPIADVFVWTGSPRIALITCGGQFDWTARSYADNLVVFAEPDVATSAIT
jgi:hypothetical protein